MERRLEGRGRQRLSVCSSLHLPSIHCSRSPEQQAGPIYRVLVGEECGWSLQRVERDAFRSCKKGSGFVGMGPRWRWRTEFFMGLFPCVCITGAYL